MVRWAWHSCWWRKQGDSRRHQCTKLRLRIFNRDIGAFWNFPVFSINRSVRLTVSQQLALQAIATASEDNEAPRKSLEANLTAPRLRSRTPEMPSKEKSGSSGAAATSKEQPETDTAMVRGYHWSSTKVRLKVGTQQQGIIVDLSTVSTVLTPWSGLWCPASLLCNCEATSLFWLLPSQSL